MELMAPVLLCALLTILSRALGENRIVQHSKIYNESELRNHMKEERFMQKKLLLNMNRTPLIINNVSPLQSLFMDAKCYPCTACMEKVINSFQSHRHFVNLPRKQDQDYDIMSEKKYAKRYKRDQKNALKTKKPKSKKIKRSQTQKSVTVTKYTRGGDVYALKVQEMETKNSTCRVYRVRRSYACNSKESDLVMAVAKKGNKKGSKRETASTMTTTHSTTTKQNEDNSQGAQDSFLPSIELY